MSLRRLIYSILLYLLIPFELLRLLLKSRKNPAYRKRIKERFARIKIPKNSKPILWIHAVSVGETIAAKPLVLQLLKQYPNHNLLLTSTTPTGSQTVKQLYGDKVYAYYFPYDLPHVIHRFIRTVKPQLVIIIETEIWPNLFASCARQNIPLLMVNARLSQRSVARYQKIKLLAQETLCYPQLIATRSDEDTQHFILLGAKPDKVTTMGNIKFNIAIPKNIRHEGKQLRKIWGIDRSVWIAASTHSGEDEIILQSYAQLKNTFPDLLLILVPRHPERFNEVFKLIDANYKIQRRSNKQTLKPTTDIILGDSMGELLLWFAAADIAFIGGSLKEVGGHNPLEAIALGIPVITGPHYFNFNDIYPPLIDANLAWVEDSETDLSNRIIEVLQSGEDYQQQSLNFMGQQKNTIDQLIHHIRINLKNQ